MQSLTEITTMARSNDLTELSIPDPIASAIEQACFRLLSGLAGDLPVDSEHGCEWAHPEEQRRQ